MTYKEMINTVSAHNLIAKKLGRPTAYIKLESQHMESITANKPFELARKVRATFIDCVAQRILEYPGYEFGVPTTFATLFQNGEAIETTVTFNLYEE